MEYDKLIGFLDGIIGLDYWMVFFGLDWIGLLDFSSHYGLCCAVASQGRFFCFLLPNLGSVVAVASQGRCFCSFFFAFWPNKVIFGKNKT